MATIYHGTPLTPRAALMDVCAGRAMCVSFYRPDDVEAVEAISPAIMFRQRRVLFLASGPSVRRGMERRAELGTILRLAGTAPIPPRSVGHHAGCAGGAQPAQRWTVERMALRAKGCTSLAHGRADRKAAPALRETRQGLPGLDRAEGRQPRLSRAHGGSGRGAGQSLASSAHAARNGSGLRLPIRQRRQHLTCTERMAI